jgi:predicted outer membrane protein
MKNQKIVLIGAALLMVTVSSGVLAAKGGAAKADAAAKLEGQSVAVQVWVGVQMQSRLSAYMIEKSQHPAVKTFATQLQSDLSSYSESLKPFVDAKIQDKAAKGGGKLEEKLNKVNPSDAKFDYKLFKAYGTLQTKMLTTMRSSLNTETDEALKAVLQKGITLLEKERDAAKAVVMQARKGKKPA